MAQRTVFNIHNLLDSDRDRERIATVRPDVDSHGYNYARRGSYNVERGHPFEMRNHRPQVLYEPQGEMPRGRASMALQQEHHYQDDMRLGVAQRGDTPFQHPPHFEYDESQRQYWPDRRFSEPEPHHHDNPQGVIREHGTFSEVCSSSSLRENEPLATSSSSSNPIPYSLAGSPPEQHVQNTKGRKWKNAKGSTTLNRNYSTQHSVSSNHPYGSLSPESSLTAGTENSSKNVVKRLKNREAAARCRHRRKQMLQDLQETVDQLTAEKDTAVRELERQLHDMQAQVKQLTALKEEHEQIIATLTRQLHSCLGYDRRGPGSDGVKPKDEGF